jgi:hypothetical protein
MDGVSKEVPVVESVHGRLPEKVSSIYSPRGRQYDISARTDPIAKTGACPLKIRVKRTTEAKGE